MKNEIDISVVIPVFNSQKSIRELVTRINEQLNQYTHEIILVDDASIDNSWAVLKELQNDFNKITVIKLAKNYGQHNATICGLKQTSGNTIITMDDDLEHLPETLPIIYTTFKERKTAILYACPKKRTKNWVRNLAGKIWNTLLIVSNKGISNASSFRVMNKNLANAIANHTEPFVHIEAIIKWYTNNISFLHIPYGKRKYGTSNYSIYQLYNLNHDLGIHYNTHILKLMRNFGITVFSFSVLLIIYFMIKKIYGNPVPGYTSLIIVGLFSTGSILWGLGYLGTYIGKMFRILNKEPQYHIEEIKSNQKS